MISPHEPSLRSAGTVSPETNSVPFPSPLTTRRDYCGSMKMVVRPKHVAVFLSLY
jgi:hypothetical protein